jgi:hypothetical protein
VGGPFLASCQVLGTRVGGHEPHLGRKPFVRARAPGNIGSGKSAPVLAFHPVRADAVEAADAGGLATLADHYREHLGPHSAHVSAAPQPVRGGQRVSRHSQAHRGGVVLRNGQRGNRWYVNDDDDVPGRSRQHVAGGLHRFKLHLLVQRRDVVQLNGEAHTWRVVRVVLPGDELRLPTLESAAEPTMTPDLYKLTGGRFEATCGTCMRSSLPISAVDAEHAWTGLQKIGWTFFRATPTSVGYARCPSCTANPPSIDDNVRAAHKGRKRQ